CIAVALPISSATATTYYVAKNGHDSHPGTESRPWKTIQKAADRVVAGDTVYVKEGIYVEQVKPKRGGSGVNQMISYLSYPGHEVTINPKGETSAWLLSSSYPANYIRVSGFKLTGAKHGLYINKKKNIIVENIDSYGNRQSGANIVGSQNIEIRKSQFRSNDEDGIWIDTKNKNILIENVLVKHNGDKNRGGMGIAIYASNNYDRFPLDTIENSFITIRNSESHHNGLQGIWVQRGFRILIRNNYLHHNGGTGIQIESGCRYIRVEDNLSESNNIHYVGEYGIWYDETMYGVVQNNIIRHNQGGLNISQSHHIISRNNLIYHNKAQEVPASCKWCPGSSGGISVDWGRTHHRGAPVGATNNVFVHNTVYENGHATSEWGGLRIFRAHDGIHHNIFKNNIISETTGRYEFDLKDTDAFELVEYNVYHNNNRDLFFRFGENDFNLQRYKTFIKVENKPIHIDPSFFNVKNTDFSLQISSPAIDIGGYLTKTSTTGSGKIMPVEDARYFSDGYEVVPGDLIQLAGKPQTVRIVEVDYHTRTLTLDQAISWQRGVGVSYPYTGTGPDIGAYESKDSQLSPRSAPQGPRHPRLQGPNSN
ncbi:MAG: right-handed parallel beta-helix repeat-containing protein, partial [Candidatus Tectomicrobia bacterium]|nr:right-handed parallel beta-helix repeat-containing protein [Candidatus Tectomicrobia bacterium]